MYLCKGGRKRLIICLWHYFCFWTLYFPVAPIRKLMLSNTIIISYSWEVGSLLSKISCSLTWSVFCVENPVICVTNKLPFCFGNRSDWFFPLLIPSRLQHQPTLSPVSCAHTPWVKCRVSSYPGSIWQPFCFFIFCPKIAKIKLNHSDCWETLLWHLHRI